MRWGVIGPGNIAEAFAKDLSKAREARGRIEAVLSHRVSSAKEYAEKFSIPHACTNLKAFLRTPVEVVYVATPHSAHFEYVLACLQQGIPVLCEKPLGLNSEQVRQMINCARNSNSFLMEGMWLRFLPSMRKVLTLIAKGTIGDIISIKASMSYRAPGDKKNRFRNPALGGGSLLDLGIYPVFLALLLLGTPARIQATGRLSKQGIDETCAALLSYPGGAYAFIESSIVTQLPMVAEIAGSKGAISILPPWNEKPEAIRVNVYGKKKRNISCEWPGKGFQFQIDEVYHCIRRKKIFSDYFDHGFSVNLASVMDEILLQLGVRYPDSE